jgi:cytochrome c oxidase cbb3-type subunit 2
MIRPLRDEVERYGHYSLAAESMYDHPFQWGSKRTGPDLARVGGRYSDDWHVAHLKDPQSVVPESIMPSYAFLARQVWSARSSRPHCRTSVQLMNCSGLPLQAGRRCTRSTAHSAMAPAHKVLPAIPT